MYLLNTVNRNIGVQKIWQFRQKLPKIKYWQIFNLAVAYPVSMTLCMYMYTKILAVFNLAILCSIAKSSNLNVPPIFLRLQYYIVSTLYIAAHLFLGGPSTVSGVKPSLS